MRVKICQIAFITGTVVLSFGVTGSMFALSNRTEAPKWLISEATGKNTTKKRIFSLPEIFPKSREALETRARSITVKVVSQDSWGSGIIIERDGQNYTVLTNKHVLWKADDKYYIQTPDGSTVQANLVKFINFDNYDLALVQFSSSNDYQVAVLGNSSNLSEGDRIVAAGFPFSSDRDPSQDNGFKFTEGTVSLLPEKSLQDGYQIGYTNEIEKGMSGGPVLNLKGQVVGINGIHAEPLWDAPYIYQDGEKPNDEMQKIMERYSWAIPIDTFLQLAPQFARQGRV